MIDFKLLSYRNGINSDLPHFFILNKGYNSGKPLTEPCPNCFILILNNEEIKNQVFWILYSLWKAKYWHYHLIGSVIPFIRISEFKKELSTILKIYNSNKAEVEKNTKMLILLEKEQAKYVTLIDKIEKVKISLANQILINR